MSTNTREFGSKATDAAIAARVQREYTPEQWAASRQVQDRANAGSIDTLLELCADRTPWVSSADARKWAINATAAEVAAKVDWLQAQPSRLVKGLPTKPQPVQVPEGRYAVTGGDGVTKFYLVDRPTEGKWKGYTFVKVQAGDDLHNLKNRTHREGVLNMIVAAGVQASMELYGRELGHCGHCGRTLTNEESRARGIGPVCASKMGF